MASRSDLGGALVLKRGLTGAASPELRQAYLVNPHDLEGVKDIDRGSASTNRVDEAMRRRMRSMRRQVLAHDVDRWARSFLDALAEAHSQEGK